MARILRCPFDSGCAGAALRLCLARGLGMSSDRGVPIRGGKALSTRGVNSLVALFAERSMSSICKSSN